MATAARRDPLASFNFIIDIEGIRAGFSEVTGLMTETDIIEYREGNYDITVHKQPGKAKYPNINFKRGFTANGKDLWEWRKSVIEGRTKRMSGTITLLDEGRKAAMVWHFYEAWPNKWGGPAFNAKNNDIAIEEFELAHEGLVLE
ncbi:MAG: phage tail protein [Acidobacteria bacterium]|nr:MAG: phage tail protein [Acidobacteriota bacterium]